MTAPRRTCSPQSPQAAGKLPCATTLSSLDAAVVDDGGVERPLLRSLRGARQRSSLQLRLPLRRWRPRRRRVRRLHLRLRLRGLRPAHAGRRPDGDLHQGLRRNSLVRLGRRLRRRRPWRRVPGLPARHRLRDRVRRLRPALPASSAHLRRDVQLGFRRRLQRLRPRLGVPPGPGPTACGPRPSSHHSTCVTHVVLR